MVFQSYDLFPHLTVLDNVLLAPCKVQKRDKEEVKQDLKKRLKATPESFPAVRSSVWLSSVRFVCTPKYCSLTR